MRCRVNLLIFVFVRALWNIEKSFRMSKSGLQA
jgi:hypothetical protein